MSVSNLKALTAGINKDSRIILFRSLVKVQINTHTHTHRNANKQQPEEDPS